MRQTSEYTQKESLKKYFLGSRKLPQGASQWKKCVMKMKETHKQEKMTSA